MSTFFYKNVCGLTPLNYQKNLNQLSFIQKQRNVCLLACLALVATTSALSFVILFKNEKIILVPPHISKDMWIKGNHVSIGYLEEMSLFFLHLLMDVNEHSILVQGKTLLRFVSPNYYGVMKERILSGQKKLQKDQMSLRFSPCECKVPDETNGLVLDVVGDLYTYVGESKVSTHRETYRMSYDIKHGIFQLLSLEVIQSDQK